MRRFTLPFAVWLTVAVAAAAAAPLGHIAVSSSAFASGGAIPSRYSAYGANHSPPLRWTPVAGARSYALVIDDPDAGGPAPFVHWIVWNIPATATGLPEDGRAGIAGRNGTGRAGYWGPHPPSGVHHYHLRVFALNAALALPASADRVALGRTMSGHVMAEGDLVGTYAAPAR